MARSTNLELTHEQAVIGCKETARHIIGLVDSSFTLIFEYYNSDLGERKQEFLRSAKILELIALDEAGKLINIWQATAKAEREGSKVVVVPDPYEHFAKGPKASNTICKMVDFISTMDAAGAFTAESQQSISFLKSVGANLKEMEKRFMAKRGDAMYVDFCNGDVIKPSNVNDIELMMELLFTDLLADASCKYLDRSTDFSLATKALVDIQKEDWTDAAIIFLNDFHKAYLKNENDNKKGPLNEDDKNIIE